MLAALIHHGGCGRNTIAATSAHVNLVDRAMRAVWCIFVSGAVLVVACKSDGACEGDGLPLQCDCKAGHSPVKPVSECSAATVGLPVLCCQSQGDCFCKQFGCTRSNADFCSCNPGGGSLTECTGPTCCATTGENAGECTCSLSCGATDMVVPSCTLDVTQCPPGQTRVDKCEPQ